MKAIEAYKEALKVRKIETNPNGYAITQNNLGTAYVKLASITNTKENLMKAIEAYKEALKVRKIGTLEYFLLKKSIGNVYYKLWEIERKNEYISKAIEAYKEFLRIGKEIEGCTYLQNLYEQIKNKIVRESK